MAPVPKTLIDQWADRRRFLAVLAGGVIAAGLPLPVGFPKATADEKIDAIIEENYFKHMDNLFKLICECGRPIRLSKVGDSG